MRRVLLLARNDLRLTMRDRASFFWMLLFPVAMMWFFGQLGAGRAGTPPVALTVVDRDGGWLARSFVELLKSQGVEVRERPASEPAPAAEKERRLTLPGGFTASLLAARPPKLQLERDAKADRDFSLAADVHVLRAISRTVGILIEMSEGRRLPPQVPEAAAAAEFDRLAARPARVTLTVATAGQGRPVPGGMAQSVPGILTMTVLMMTLIYGGVFLAVERREGMLRRQVSLPLSRRGLLLGKLMGRIFVAGLQVTVLLAVGRLVFGVHFGRSPIALALLLAAYVFSVAGLATFFGAVLRTPEQAAAVGWIGSMVMAALGGCWWPSEVMPRWLWTAAHVFPTAWAMDGFHALISFGRGVEAVLPAVAFLLAFGAVCSLLGARMLKPV